MKGFTDQGKRTQEAFETFLVMKELTADGKIEYKSNIDDRNKINHVVINMDRSSAIFRIEIYMRENNKEITSGTVAIQFNLDNHVKIINPIKASNLKAMNLDSWYNGITICFNKSKEFQKILNVLKKFL